MSNSARDIRRAARALHSHIARVQRLVELALQHDPKLAAHHLVGLFDHDAPQMLHRLRQQLGLPHAAHVPSTPSRMKALGGGLDATIPRVQSSPPSPAGEEHDGTDDDEGGGRDGQ